MNFYSFTFFLSATSPKSGYETSSDLYQDVRTGDSTSPPVMFGHNSFEIKVLEVASKVYLKIVIVRTSMRKLTLELM